MNILHSSATSFPFSLSRIGVIELSHKFDVDLPYDVVLAVSALLQYSNASFS